MSAASRLAKADTRIVRPSAGANIGLNSAGVPGGISAVPVDGPLVSADGYAWLPCDAEPWSASIGYQLAVELGTRPRVDLVKRTRVEVPA